MRQKEFYAAPETEVLKLRLEGVIAASPITGDPDANYLGPGAEVDF